MPRPLWYAAIPLSDLVMIGYTVFRILQAIRPKPSPTKTDEMA